MKSIWKSSSLRIYPILGLIAFIVALYSLYIMQANSEVHNQSAWIAPVIFGLATLWLLGKTLSVLFDQQFINTILGGLGYTEETAIDYNSVGEKIDKLKQNVHRDSPYFIDTNDLRIGKAYTVPIYLSSGVTFFYCFNREDQAKEIICLVRDRTVPLSMGGLKAYRKPHTANTDNVVVSEVNE